MGNVPDSSGRFRVSQKEFGRLGREIKRDRSSGRNWRSLNNVNKKGMDED